MNWDQVEGKWKQFAGSAKERWGSLTDDDLQTLTGQKNQLVGKIQERYGIAKAVAIKQIDDWSRALKETHANAPQPGEGRSSTLSLDVTAAKTRASRS